MFQRVSKKAISGLIALSVALSVVGVFIAIKIALNLFHEGVVK